MGFEVRIGKKSAGVPAFKMEVAAAKIRAALQLLRRSASVLAFKASVDHFLVELGIVRKFGDDENWVLSAAEDLQVLFLGREQIGT